MHREKGVLESIKIHLSQTRRGLDMTKSIEDFT